MAQKQKNRVLQVNTNPTHKLVNKLFFRIIFRPKSNHINHDKFSLTYFLITFK